MKSINQLHMDILNITMKIHKDFPELSKYIKEVPIKCPNINKDISRENLLDYHNSLITMLKSYALTHVCEK